MKEKAARRIAYGGLLESWTEAHEIILENDRLVIPYKIEMSNETRMVQLGWFSNSNGKNLLIIL